MIYDFGKPITFDFCVFLATARLELAMKMDHRISAYARTLGEINHGSRYSLDDRLWRLHNLTIPICDVTPGSSGTTYLSLMEIARI